MRQIGILHRPQLARAEALAQSVKSYLSQRGIAAWVCSAWNETDATASMGDTDLIVSIGGDGTILHCARMSAPYGIPILGVKLGQLGFITEFNDTELESFLPRALAGEGWIEERAMLRSTVNGESLIALNDAVVRCTRVRLVDITLEVGQQRVTTYRADGVIVATATGSTAYSLAAGGPILMPEATNLLVQPVCSHLGLHHGLVLPGDTIISLIVDRHDGVVLSLDGQMERPLHSGARVTITTSEFKARFLRLQSQTNFLASLHNKLGGTCK